MALEKAILATETSGHIPVMFNPTEYTQSGESQFSGDGSNLQFNRTGGGDFSVELLFDSYEEEGAKQDVRKKTKAITDLLQPSVKGSQSHRPQIVSFVWGKFQFRGVLTKADQKFTMFLGSGIPVRCELSITLKEVLEPGEAVQNAGLGACRKLHVVHGDDRLDLIADQLLGSAERWHFIADANNIEDPLSFPGGYIGRTLVIPDVAAGGGRGE